MKQREKERETARHTDGDRNREKGERKKEKERVCACVGLGLCIPAFPEYPSTCSLYLELTDSTEKCEYSAFFQTQSWSINSILRDV